MEEQSNLVPRVFLGDLGDGKKRKPGNEVGSSPEETVKESNAQFKNVKHEMIITTT